MSTSVAPGFERTEISPSEFDLVRARVDNLEVKEAEARKPWYRQLPLWISILSLLVSAGFSGYTAYVQQKEHRAEELKKRLESVRATLLQIADIRDQFLLLAASPDQNNMQMTQRSSQLNTKKQILIENADALIDGIETEVSPALLVELAYEESTDGQYGAAKRHYEDGLRSKQLDPLSSVSILRCLGELYMKPNTGFQDIEKGRADYRQALNLAGNNQDDASLSSKTFIHSDWAYSEFLDRNTAEGEKHLAEAQAAAMKIDRQDEVARRQALSYIAMAISYAGGTKQPPATANTASDATLAGQWRISYPGESGRSGVVTVVSGPDAKTTTVNVDIFENSNLVRKYSGSLYRQADGAMQVEWNGVQSTPSPAMPWMYVYGITSLRMSKDGSMVGKESVVGDTTRVIRLQKLGRS